MKISDIRKVEKKRWEKIFIWKNTFKRYADLLFLVNEDKSYYAFIKDFNRFMYNQTFHCDKKDFDHNWLQSSSFVEILDKICLWLFWN